MSSRRQQVSAQFNAFKYELNKLFACHLSHSSLFDWLKSLYVAAGGHQKNTFKLIKKQYICNHSQLHANKVNVILQNLINLKA